MKKNILAIAIASAVAAPVAMANGPTVYGQLQAEIANVDRSGTGVADNNNRNGAVADDASGLKMGDNKRGRLGIKGSEDLGNGLKAIYHFEFQVNTTVADVDDGDRIGMVGLQGDFGRVELGQIKSPYKYTGGVAYDPFVTTYLEARKNSGGMTGTSYGQNGFLANSIGYSKDFGNIGLWVTYGVDSGNADTTTGNNGDIVAAVKYTGGNFEAFVSSAMQADQDGNEATDDAYTANKIGGQYKAGQHTISAQYEMVKDDDAVRAGNENFTVAFLGYQMKMGATKLVAQLGQTSDDDSTKDKDYMALGAIHNLSKKTRVFAGYRNTALNDAADSSYTALSAGLRIDF